MSKQLTYEDVEVGIEVPPLVKETSTRMSAEWAGASGDYDPIHYDKEYAKLRRFPSAIVNGRFRVAWLMQLMTNWIGDEGFLKKLECRQSGMDIIGDQVKCKGVVIDKYVQDSEHLVECEVWTENPKGEKTVPGKAVVRLPSKA
ncbi:MaoC/PaaZ C-terminal domain-containing protein [Chloroflexota bacterium]